MFLLVLLGTVPSHAQQRTVIEDIQLHVVNQNELELKIIAAQPIDYRAFMLPAPYRIVFDALGSDFGNISERHTFQKISFAQAMRFGNFSSVFARLVLDTSEPVVIRSVSQYISESDRSSVISLRLSRSSEETFFRHRLRGAFFSREGLVFEEEVKEEAKEAQPPARSKPKKQIKQPQDDLPLIVIDAGHGGIDSGAIGVSGIKEKDINLDMAKRLHRLINESGRARAMLTRQSDIFIPLQKRSAIAHHHGADLFISIHADSIHKKHIKGFSIYGLSHDASDDVAARLAQNENRADIVGGIDIKETSQDVAYILIDLTQKNSMKRAQQIAQDIIEHLRGKVTLLEPTLRSAGFLVLKVPSVPSLLIEVGFLSNEEEERQLRSDDYRENLAKQMGRAILASFAPAP